LAGYTASRGFCLWLAVGFAFAFGLTLALALGFDNGLELVIFLYHSFFA
jgi:hypothetical protein